MFIRNVDGMDKPCIYRQARNEKEQALFIKNKIISHEIILISGGVGSGKSNAMNTICWEIMRHDYTGVYVTEKTGDELANAFFYFPPDKDYQLTMMQEQAIEYHIKPVKIYHPFSFDIPFTKKLPPIFFYTTSIKNIRHEGFSAILPTESPQTIDISVDIAKRLTDVENMYDFMWKLSEDILVDETEMKPREDEFYLPIEASGEKRTIKNAKLGLKLFREHFFIHANNSSYNIDYVKMLNDSKNVHFLTTKYIKDDKIKKFAIIDFLLGIADALDSGLVKKPVVLNFEELKILIPEGNLTYAEEVLLKLLIKLFSRLRTKAYIIGTTQTIFDINRSARSLFNINMLGRLNINDLRVLIKDYNFRSSDQDKLLSLKTGEFVFWESEFEEEKISEKFLIDVPPFKIAEQGELFDDIYRQHYLDLMHDNKDLYHDMLILRNQLDKNAKYKFDEFVKKEKMKKQVKELKKEGKKDEYKDLLMKERNERKLLLMKQAYDLFKENPNMSFSNIARQLKVKSHKTIKKYISEYEKVKTDEMQNNGM